MALSIAGVVLLTLTASPVQAQSREVLTVGYEGGWYMLAGATGGATFARDGNGAFIGGELSLARLRRGLWYGLYADGAYDSSQQNAVVTAGPELGYSVFGLDGGIGLRTGADGVAFGPQARVLLTLGLVSLYGRIGWWPEASNFQMTTQVGAMLKFPIVSPWGFGPSAPWDMGNRGRTQ